MTYSRSNILKAKFDAILVLAMVALQDLYNLLRLSNMYPLKKEMDSRINFTSKLLKNDTEKMKVIKVDV